MLKTIHDSWLEKDGVLVAGVDHYLEHEESLTWPEYVGVHMTTLSISSGKKRWKALDSATLNYIKSQAVIVLRNLVMLGRATRLQDHTA